MDIVVVLLIFFLGGLLLAGPFALIADILSRTNPDKAHYFFGDDIDRNGNPIDEDF